MSGLMEADIDYIFDGMMVGMKISYIMLIVDGSLMYVYDTYF